MPGPAEPGPVLRVEGLAKSFGGNPILKGVSLEVRPAEFLTLLGPSGCGKTTTLRIVGGFDLPDSGRVLLEGMDVTRLPPYRRDVHTVFQHYALFPHLEIFENIAFGLRIRRLPEEEIAARVREALDLVQLAGFERRRPDQLSGGQKQRIALARAIVGRPKLLLLDEPLGALDFKLRKRMQLELKDIQRRLGIAFVYVTHDQEEALTMSDRIVVMNKGVIEQVGGPRDIYDRPATAFVADFIGAANLLDGRFVRSEGGTAELMLENELKVTLPAPPGLEAREGEPLKVAIRPEKVRVLKEGETPSPASEGLTLSCVLKETVFLGSSSQWVLAPFQSSKKTLVSMREAASNGGELPRAGERVLAELRYDDLRVLR